MKVLFFGDRNWCDERTIAAFVDRLPIDAKVVNGACSGADEMASILSKARGLEVFDMPADWDTYKRAAGPIRNRQMLKTHPDIDACIGFHNSIETSRGSKDMRDEAKRQGFKVRIQTSLWPLISEFKDDFSFLSNFHPSVVTYRDRSYLTVEHAYQALKSLDPREQQWVAEAKHPAEAKRRGRSVKVRHDWENVKVTVMHDLLVSKFADVHLREMLLATDDATLVEGNTWNDTFWGVCKGRGTNHLGKLLMKVRDGLNGASAKDDVVVSLT